MKEHRMREIRQEREQLRIAKALKSKCFQIHHVMPTVITIGMMKG